MRELYGAELAKSFMLLVSVVLGKSQVPEHLTVYPRQLSQGLPLPLREVTELGGTCRQLFLLS